MKDQQDKLRRYTVILQVRHPDIEAERISREFGLSPHACYTAGKVRVLPNGRILPGLATESSWNHIYDYSGDARPKDSLLNVVTFLEQHKVFLRKITLQGGTVELYVQLPGDTNIGDTLPWDLLGRMGNLRVSLSVEVFPNFPYATQAQERSERGG
jgi:hypothetical protein